MVVALMNTSSQELMEKSDEELIVWSLSQELMGKSDEESIVWPGSPSQDAVEQATEN